MHPSPGRVTARDATPADPAPARSLYIHIPFCAHKCHYCDFYSFVDARDQQAPFLDALVRELASLAPLAAPRGLTTLFIGWGTPSLLRVDLWQRLLDALHDLFNLRPILDGLGEFTVECNPESVTRGLMNTLAAGHVTRISLGAQSFNQRRLAVLERKHDPAAVARALAVSADAGIERRSIDLIYAIPDQSMDDLRADLDTAVTLDPSVEHLSAYCLTYEPNTPLTARARRGEITPAADDDAAAMQTLIHDTLTGVGFAHYEVSNFARSTGIGVSPASPAVSLHNLAYWRTEGWLAAGPSASAHILTTDPATGLPAGARWKNAPNLRTWLAGVTETGSAPAIDREPPDPRRTLRERLMMGVRLAEGLDAERALDHADRLGGAAALKSAVDRQCALGLLELADARWRPTQRGFLFADAIAVDLMAAIE